jgi:hypothetical protein
MDWLAVVWCAFPVLIVIWGCIRPDIEEEMEDE